MSVGFEGDPEWIESDTVQAIHLRQLAEHGGEPGLRDEGLLDSALNRPLQLWNYADPPPDLCALAAAYTFGIARNHPFFDGNKRTSAVVCELFLVVNGRKFLIDEIAKYPWFLGLAAGEISESAFTDWLLENTAALPDAP
jgi:death-on-curing protein